MKHRILEMLAMFLFMYVAGTVFFMFKEIYINGEFQVFHYHGSKIPILVELVESGAILVLATILFIKSLKGALNE